MVKYKFNNEYEVILCALSLILDCLETEDQLFAAQWTWWLASIILFTEILIYYRQYKIFPSDYVQNCIATPLPDQSSKRVVMPDEDIPELDLVEEIGIESSGENHIEHLSRKKFLPNSFIQGFRQDIPIDTTWSGRTFKLQKLNQKELRKWYPGFNNK